MNNIWVFLLMLILSVSLPFLVDQMHIRNCRDKGITTFVPLSGMFSNDEHTYLCNPVQRRT